MYLRMSLVCYLIDCYSRTTWLTLLKAKSDIFYAYESFYKMTETQFGVHIKVVQTNNKAEYTYDAFQESLRSYGVTERKNRHLLEVARSQLFTMNAPKYL